MPTDEELTGGIVGYGISNIFCAFFGGLPTATYSQNVGIVSTTKVVSRVVMGLAAVILLAAGLIPKFFFSAYDNSVLCTRRCDNLCICFDYNDGNQTDHDRANGFP